MTEMKIWEHMKQIEGVKACHYDGEKRIMTIVCGQVTKQEMEAVKSRVAYELQPLLLDWFERIDFLYWGDE